MVEQGRRRIERLTRPMLGFGSFRTARQALAGIKAMAMLGEGRVRVVPGNDTPTQRAFVHRISGLAG